VSITSWQVQPGQQVQPEQQQVQESAWKLIELVPVQQVQLQEPVPELLLFSCSQQRKQGPGTGRVREKSSFSFDTYLFPFVINRCMKTGYLFKPMRILSLSYLQSQYFFAK
jgi:hypothetical protein